MPLTLCPQVSVVGYAHLRLRGSPGVTQCLLVLEFAVCLLAMSNEVETSTTNGQPDQQAAPKAPSKKEKKKGMKKSEPIEGSQCCLPLKKCGV